jgi:hypothetical protein
MRTRPEISDDSIIACLYDSFRLRVNQVNFLPVGANFDSFAFRVTVDDGSSSFLKLSRRAFDEVADLAEYAEQILGLQGSAEDREEGLGQLVSQFLPGRVVEIAHRSYPSPE